MEVFAASIQAETTESHELSGSAPINHLPSPRWLATPGTLAFMASAGLPFCGDSFLLTSSDTACVALGGLGRHGGVRDVS